MPVIPRRDVAQQEDQHPQVWRLRACQAVATEVRQTEVGRQFGASPHASYQVDKPFTSVYADNRPAAIGCLQARDLGLELADYVALSCPMAAKGEMQADDFYRSPRLKCPACGAVNTIPAENLVVRGLDGLMDHCTTCDRYILIDLSDDTLKSGKVIFEAFDDIKAMQEAVSKLAEKHRRSTPSSPWWRRRRGTS